MNYSVFDIFTIGIGPSSSHTVGPMKAAFNFITDIYSNGQFDSIHTIQCEFFGSLALTGKGHGTDKAFLLGIQGYRPESINSNNIPKILERVETEKTLILNFNQSLEVKFNPKKGIKFNRRKFLPYHPNAMTITAYDFAQNTILQKTYYSIGGGTIVEDNQKAFVKELDINDFLES